MRPTSGRVTKPLFQVDIQLVNGKAARPARQARKPARLFHPRFSGRGGRPENESSGAWAFGLAAAGFAVFRPRPEALPAGFWAGSAAGFESNFRASEILIRFNFQPSFCLALTLAAAAWLGVPGAARAQRRPPATPIAPDTTRPLNHPQHLAEVRVQAVRPASFAVGSRVETLDSAALSLGRGGTLADALAARSTAYVRSYGPGQLATISLRGTSASQTAVLWNGLNIQLPTLGQNDFGVLPLAANAEVSIQPGPAAALYGSGAVGGAVLLRTGAPVFGRAPAGSVQLDGGSFGLRGASAAASGGRGRMAARVTGSYRQATNNYPYVVREFEGPVRRTLTGAALRHQWSLAPDVALRVGAGGLLTAAAWLTDTDRDIQPAVGTAGPAARQRDQSRRLLLGYHHLGTASRQWAVRGAWFEDVLNYHDGLIVSNSRVRTTQGQAEYTAALGPAATLRLGAEIQHFVAELNEYTRPVLAENRAAAFALFRAAPRPGLRLSANLRQALLPQGNPLCPILGVEWEVVGSKSDSLEAVSTHPSTNPPTHHLTVRASAARSYRAPTLNERYWAVGGNPDLRPETGLGAEAGLRHEWPLARRVALLNELTIYTQRVDDWVQWAPGPDGLWRPRNLRQVLTYGLEASTRLTLAAGPHRLAARAAYAYTVARTHRATNALDPVPSGRPLPYVPLHTANASLDYAHRRWRLGATGSVVAYRYLDATATGFLPGYGLLGGSLGYALPLPGPTQILLLIQGSNLLSHAYDSYAGRPAPPRALLLSLRVGFNE